MAGFKDLCQAHCGRTAAHSAGWSLQHCRHRQGALVCWEPGKGLNGWPGSGGRLRHCYDLHRWRTRNIWGTRQPTRRSNFAGVRPTVFAPCITIPINCHGLTIGGCPGRSLAADNGGRDRKRYSPYPTGGSFAISLEDWWRSYPDGNVIFYRGGMEKSWFVI